MKRYLSLPRPGTQGCRVGRMTQDPQVGRRTRSSSRSSRTPSTRCWVAGSRRSPRRSPPENCPASIVPADLARTLAAVIQGGYVLARAKGEQGPMDAAIRGAVALLDAAHAPSTPITDQPDEGDERHDRSDRNQRLRPHRPQLPARRPAQRCGCRGRRDQRHRRCRDARLAAGVGLAGRASGRRAGRRGRDPRCRGAHPRHLGARAGPHPLGRRAASMSSSSPPAGSRTRPAPAST